MNTGQVIRELRGILNSGVLSQDQYEALCYTIRLLGGEP